MGLCPPPPSAHTHTRKGRKKKIFPGPSRLCRFPLLGFNSVQPFGLFAVYANFLLSQKQIEVSLELLYPLTSLASPFNIFHMCINPGGRQLPCSPRYPMPGSCSRVLKPPQSEKSLSFPSALS